MQRNIGGKIEEIWGPHEQGSSTWNDILANEFDSSGRVHGI